MPNTPAKSDLHLDGEDLELVSLNLDGNPSPCEKQPSYSRQADSSL